MKAIKFAALLLAITAVASCQQQEETTYQSDPAAVRIAPTVGSPFTRSNPVDPADAPTSTAFNAGDAVAVAADGQAEVTYTLGADNAWTPPADKYLRWSAEAMTFSAYHPVGVNNASMTTFDLPTDQSTLPLIGQADYMTYTSPAPQAKTPSIALALTRKTARIIIGTTFLDQYAAAHYAVTNIDVHSNTNGYAGSTPRSGQITIAPYAQADKRFALLAPTTADDAATFLTLTVTKTDAATTQTLIVKGIPALEAGKSYAVNVEVGKNTVKITNITVTDWATGKVIPGGEASEATNANPTTHTVHIDKAGELTDALIATAIGSEKKDLKITGAMGTADFATLLSWGTEGLTDTDADLLHNLDLTGVIGLTAVPKFAFVAIVEEKVYSLRSLQHIALPSTVTSVEGSAFAGCTSLAEFTAPNVQAVKERAFGNCTSLTKFDATKLLTVGEYAFSSCAALTEFTAPELQTMDGSAFFNCTVLKKFTAPKLQSVSEYAFNVCTSLTEFTAIKLRTVENSAFNGCKALTTFTAPELQTVKSEAFVNCASLATVTAPELQTVGRAAFANCASLATVTAPKLKTVGELAFNGCPVLTELRLTTDADIELLENAFAGTPSDACILYLHQNKKSGGIGTPAVDADGKWGGLEWQNIVFVNDDGTIIP